MINQINHPLEWSHHYHVKTSLVTERIYLLLHGYQLDGQFMLKTFTDVLDEKLVAPNAPFMVPISKPDGHKAGFAWYYFDPKTGVYYIDMQVPVGYIRAILDRENPQKLPVTVIGYSQGGYLAPKVAELISDVDQVIGIACKFRNEKFEQRPAVQYHQINCIHDKVVDYKTALEEFNKLENNSGTFHTLENQGHRLNKTYLNKLLEII